MLNRILVMGSREFDDRDWLRSLMLDHYRQAVKAFGSDARVQFVFPSEVGRDRIERPVRGVARTGFNILHDARQRGVRNPNMLMPLLVPIDWAQVETVDTYHNHFHHEVLDSRKIPANFLWNRDVCDAGTWAEYIISQGGNPDPEFLNRPDLVIAVESDGADAWCRDMVKQAADSSMAALIVSHRTFTAGRRK